MDGLYIYWLVIDLIYLIICFMIKKNKKYYCNYEILWPLFNIAYLAGQNDASAKQISYYAGSISLLIFLYFIALEIYKGLKDNKIKETTANK